MATCSTSSATARARRRCAQRSTRPAPSLALEPCPGPRSGGCAGDGLGRYLRRDRSGAPPVAALPRHRRHPCGEVLARPGSRALPLRGAALSPRASLPRRLVRAPPAGAGRRRHRRRRRRARRAAHLARCATARQGGRRVAQEGARARLRFPPCASAPPPPTELRSWSARASRPCCRSSPPFRRSPRRPPLSAGSLGAFAPPPGVARLVIARDNDIEGERAAERLGPALRAGRASPPPSSCPGATTLTTTCSRSALPRSPRASAACSAFAAGDGE